MSQSNQTASPSRWMTPGEAAELLEVDANTVRALIKMGRIRERDIPSRRRLLRADVEVIANVSDCIGQASA